MNATYIDIIRKSPRADEAKMWESIEMLSNFIEELKISDSEIADEILRSQYVLLNGPHFNEEMARDEVGKMHHADWRGELVNIDDVRKMHGDKELWDAYVGYNAFLHDIGDAGIDDEDVMKLAEKFWFKDEDFPGDSKVWWYFSNK